MSKKNILLRWLIVFIVLLFGIFSTLNLTINDNALDLLPDGAVRGDLQKLQQIGLVDRLFITLSADKKEFPDELEARAALKKSAEDLGLLLERSEHFTGVLAGIKVGNQLQLFDDLWNYLPVLLDEDDLAEIKKMISRSEIDKALQRKFIQLNSPAGIGSVKRVQRDPLDFNNLLFAKLGYLRSEFSMQFMDGFFMSSDSRNCLVLAESTESLTDSDNAQVILDDLERSYQKALLPGIQARVIGTLPHTLANSNSVKRDLKRLLPVATILLLLLLATTLRNIRAVVVLGIPFLAALPAIGLTSCIYGSVSALALGFGIVLLGIAVDFSIHLYLALDRASGGRLQALKRIARPIFFATMTTTSVFVVLLFSDVASHRQMATLALAGVLLAVFFAWILIPAIVPEGTRKSSPADINTCHENNNNASTIQKMILILWVLLLGFGLATWPKLHYNGDLRVLDAPDVQVRADEEHFKSVWGDKGEQAFVVSTGKNQEDALDSNNRLYRFLRENDFGTFQTISPVLPGPEAQKDNRNHWIEFWSESRLHFERDFADAALNRGFSVSGFAPFLKWLNREPELMPVELILDSSLQVLAATMIRSSGDGTGESEMVNHTILTTVEVDSKTLPVLLDFAEHEGSITVLANEKWRSEVEKLLRKDIMLLSLAAGCCVTFLVSVQFRNARAVAAVLAPVLSALAAMSIFCWITDGQLNMMHLIMGIMVIGLSVDYGIFVVCSRLEGSSGTVLFAVSVCAASSLVGFGVLAFAGHPALHSLGVTVLVGIGASWPTALLVSPSLLGKKGA